MQPDRQAGAADLLQQRVEAVEARLGRELEVVAVAAHRAEQAAHLGERRAAGLLDALGARPRRPRASSGSLCRTAPTWSTITLTAWATMSWSSRAIRARSSATAMRAAASRSRSALGRALLRRLGLLGPLAQREAGEPADREQERDEDELAGRVVGSL